MLAAARVEATVPAAKLSRAREFYEGVLGLSAAGSYTPGVDVVYECGDATRLLVYEHPGPPVPPRTVAQFVVDDVAGAVAQLRERGVRFEDYDMPELRTVDGVAVVGEMRFAWFKDPDLNVLAIHD